MGSAVRRRLIIGIIVAGVVLPSIWAAYWFRALNLAPGAQVPAEAAHRPRFAFAAVTDRPVYRTGDVVVVAITLTNVGRVDVDLSFGTPCFWTFLVYDRLRATEFDWSVGRLCVAMLEQFVLAPGESWGRIVRYHLVTTDGRPLPTDQNYEIVPSFWNYPEYQEFVSRTDTALFYLKG